ncbi:MAG: response regulator [Burkholderiales bacterium]|nr:response regulator [Burkholderiales bacterium]MDE2397460.1 response regulator [Burkholderiales bacterium]MDE2455317.1 response regulator [Burkholderiales bacterium]
MQTVGIANRRQPGPRGADLRVLVVDDEGATRAGVAALIPVRDDRPCQVLLAANQAQALDLDRRFNPQIIVLDVDLEGHDGLALMPHFLPHARVIVLTSQGGLETRARALALGASAFIDKRDPAAVLAKCLATLADAAD